jgi:hypothetical protein
MTDPRTLLGMAISESLGHRKQIPDEVKVIESSSQELIRMMKDQVESSWKLVDARKPKPKTFKVDPEHPRCPKVKIH